MNVKVPNHKGGVGEVGKASQRRYRHFRGALDQLLGGFFFFFFFFFFLYHVFIVTVQELACSASYSVKKTLISKQNNKVKLITDHLQVRQIPGTSLI